MKTVENSKLEAFQKLEELGVCTFASARKVLAMKQIQPCSNKDIAEHMGILVGATLNDLYTKGIVDKVDNQTRNVTYKLSSKGEKASRILRKILL